MKAGSRSATVRGGGVQGGIAAVLAGTRCCRSASATSKRWRSQRCYMAAATTATSHFIGQGDLAVISYRTQWWSAAGTSACGRTTLLTLNVERGRAATVHDLSTNLP